MAAMTRSTRREALDGDEVGPTELRSNLRDMARLNRLPGGVGTSVAAVCRLLDGSPLPVLDIGAGYGDFARRLTRARGVRVVLSDLRPDILAIARAGSRDAALFDFVEADARDLPFADGSMSVVHASLVMHHLDPADAALALREMRRVASRGVVINDLRRSRFALAATALPVLALSRSPVTRHDGVLSVRRSYTLAELDGLAASAGLARVTRTASWWPRVTTTYQ